MSDAQTVTINGRVYDARTGHAIDTSVVQEPSHSPSHDKTASHHATDMHHANQRSQTLNRLVTKKPTAKTSPVAQPVAAPRHHTAITKSPSITKFAPHPKVTPSQPGRARTMDIAPIKHPSLERAHKLQAQKKAAIQHKVMAQTTKPASSREIKEQAIAEALEKAPTKKQQPTSFKKKSFLSRHPRTFSIASACLAVVLLGGYLTYLNAPNLSVRVAAAQAGIDATYPEYKPDGYRLNSAIAVAEGTVKLQFASNSGPQKFEVTQTKSSWDSATVVDNLVKPKSNDSYITTNERGLTIYTYDSNAAWVNGGILYTISGDAPLSGEQIRRIATSL